METFKDASSLYEVESRKYYAERPGVRIGEVQISPTHKVPWHLHNNVQDTFYVIEGCLKLFCANPVRSFARVRRNVLCESTPASSATFLVVQIGKSDYVPLV